MAHLALGAFVVGLSGAMSPGPVLAATVTEALRRGARAGPQIVAGHALLEMALVAALLVGLDRYVRQDGVRTLLLLGGGTALVGLAVRMGFDLHAGRLLIVPNSSEPTSTALHPITLGILLSLSNPYWILWWATIGLAMLSPAIERGWGSVASVYAGHILADLVWYSAVSLTVAGGRRMLPLALWRAVAIACAMGMFWLGVVFLWTGLRRGLDVQSSWYEPLKSHIVMRGDCFDAYLYYGYGMARW